MDDQSVTGQHSHGTSGVGDTLVTMRVTWPYETLRYHQPLERSNEEDHRHQVSQSPTLTTFSLKAQDLPKDVQPLFADLARKAERVHIIPEAVQEKLKDLGDEADPSEVLEAGDWPPRQLFGLP